MIYMDNSATSYPKPQRVIDGVREVLEKYYANPGRSSHKAAIETAFKLYEARVRVATFINTAPENIAFTYNATYALNMAIHGAVNEEDVVATSVFEHNSVLRPLYRKKAENKVKIRFLKFDTHDTNVMISDFENMLLSDEKPSMLILTHTSNVTGFKMPLLNLGALCRKHGVLFILDASQGLGASRVDMELLGVDILCSSGHKGLYGIAGSGFIAFGKSFDRSLTPLIVGGTGMLPFEEEMPMTLPERFEAGTQGIAGAVSIGDGIEYINDVGSDTILSLSRRNRIRLTEGLSVIKGVKLISPEADSDSIVLFNIGELPSEEVSVILDGYGIASRAGYHCSPLAHKFLGTRGALRLSVSAFNTEKECDKVLFAVKEISENL